MKRTSWAHPSRRLQLKPRPDSTKRFPTLATLLAPIMLVPLALTGCADPAADAPDAVVSEASDVQSAERPSGDDARSYVIDTTSSSIDFVGSKVTGSHDGGFEAFAGTLAVSGDDPTTGTIEVTIDTTSLWSDNDQLTGHLKSDDFFSVEEYPMASFSSTEIVTTDDGYDVVGDLELRGTRKQVRFPAEITVTDSEISAKAEFSIKRFDFGLEYPGRADDLIRDEVLVRLDLNANAVEPAS